MIKAMKFVSIPTRDQQKALEFYTTKLGFRVITDQPFDGEQRWIELGVGRSGTGHHAVHAARPRRPDWNLHRHLVRV